MTREKRERAAFDVLGKIERERIRRDWTEYTLAKNAGIPQSTISTWYRRQLQPSIASIEKICRAFGMTLSEFFDNDSDTQSSEAENEDTDSRPRSMTREQRELFEIWARLSPSQKSALIGLFKTMEL